MNWKRVDAMARGISPNPRIPQYYANIKTLATIYGISRGVMSSFLTEACVPPHSAKREKRYHLWDVEEAMEKTRWKNKDERGGYRAGSFRDGIIDPI